MKGMEVSYLLWKYIYVFIENAEFLHKFFCFSFGHFSGGQKVKEKTTTTFITF